MHSGEGQCQPTTHPDKLKLLSDKNKPQRGQRRKYLSQCHQQTLAYLPEVAECMKLFIVYKATVTSANDSKIYYGLTENTFKQRYNNHTQSIRHEKYEHSTELSRHLWTLKREGKAYDITWSIHKRASAFSNASRKCQLCIAEKVAIITAEKELTLNKKSELVSKCRHENTFYLSNFVT